MRNTLMTECLGQAFENLFVAKQEHDKARDEYEGYSWGYHGHGYVKRVEDAAEELEKRLDAYIAEKVKKALAALPTPTDTPIGQEMEQ